MSHLANEGLKFPTLNVYLSAIRHMQIEAAMPDPFKGAAPMARLEYGTRGVKKLEAEKQVGPEAVPSHYPAHYASCLTLRRSAINNGCLMPSPYRYTTESKRYAYGFYRITIS